MLFHSAQGASGYKKETYQSLLFHYNNTVSQIKISRGELLNSLSTPNSNISGGGYTVYDGKINPTGNHFAISHYGANSLANSPFKYGAFSYEFGFSGTTVTVTQSTARSTGLQWHPSGTAILSIGDIYSYVFPFNTATATGSTGTGYMYASSSNTASFNSTGSAIARVQPFSTPNVATINWTGTTGGTSYTPTTNSTSPSYTPVWLSDNSFVFIGDIAYGYNASTGFTNSNFTISSTLGISPTIVGKYSDSILLGQVSNTLYAIGFSKTTGLSIISSYTDANGILTPLVDSSNNKIYYTTNAVSSLYYLRRVDWAGSTFSSFTNLSSKSTPANLTQIFTHTL